MPGRESSPLVCSLLLTDLIFFLSAVHDVAAWSAQNVKGLLPPVFSVVHPPFRTPWISQIIVDIAAMTIAGLFPIGLLGPLVSIGTLLAFAIVCAGVFVLRFTDPQIARPFRTPAVWLVSPLSVVSCGYLMKNLPPDTWARLIIWLIIGLVIYFTYGCRHSRLEQS